MNAKVVLIMGIFVMIFGIDGILLSDSSIPECAGFTGMGWFVFIHMSFDPRAILSNPECLLTFYIQTGCGILFVIGLALVANLAVKRRQSQLNGDLLR